MDENGVASKWLAAQLGIERTYVARLRGKGIKGVEYLMKIYFILKNEGIDVSLEELAWSEEEIGSFKELLSQ